MSKPKLVKRIYYNLLSIFRRTERFISISIKQLIWLLRRTSKKQLRDGDAAQTGYVLPTVTMVMLVVVLLSTAIMLRSFDRTEQALFVRTNEAALAAGAGPGVERGLAKLREAEGSAEKTLTETELNNELGKPAGGDDKYTLPDETRLTIAYDIEGVNEGEEVYNQESIDTAWKFPVDTDGNGIYDSFNVYGIFVRSPKLSNDELVFERARTPLDSVAPPIPAIGSLKEGCERLGVSRATVGTTDWYKVGATLKKSIFVYSAVVPISKDEVPGGDKYEAKSEQAGIVALELQQDRERVPLSNNAVVYEDDLQITPGGGLQLNGRVFTNSNLLTGRKQEDIEYYLVSSPQSCFYEMENNKIVVGGNVGIGQPGDSNELGDVRVDLFNIGGGHKKSTMGSANKPVNNTPDEITYDGKRYEDRLNSLVTNTLTGAEPQEVLDKIAQGTKSRNEALYDYFKARTRRVPTEEPAGNDEISPQGSADQPASSGGPLRPPQDAIDIDTNGLNLNITGDTALPAATEPDLLSETGVETRIGDRVLIGNGLPAKWYDESIGRFATFTKSQDFSGVLWDEYKEEEEDQDFRSRQTRIQPIGDLDPVRDGFWEIAAAEQPEFLFSGRGGLRVITGAGVYERKNSFLPPPPDLNNATAFNPSNPGTNPPDYDDPGTANQEQFRIVWPDSMPMSPLGIQIGGNYLVKGYDNSGTTGWVGTEGGDLETRNINEAAVTPTIDGTNKYLKGDLRMRATAVYLYNDNAYEGPGTYQTPVACVSSYYDPSDPITARNQTGLPWGADPNGKSNNGIVYGAPTVTASTLTGISAPGTTGLFAGDEYGAYTTLAEKIGYQANLVFPSGRFVNPTLRYALESKRNNEDLSLSQQSAIDSTICALQILDKTITPNDTLIPHGAIREVAFLDGRQIRAIEGGDEDKTNYDLFVEDRQPLEIRVTQLDLDLMRKQSIGNMSIKNAPSSAKEEFLLPNSGIIYATRDDALPDVTDRSEDLPIEDEDNQNLTSSAIDFKLDSTRRPNGIMLVNGSILARKNNDNNYDGKEAERGIILASNVPVYVQADPAGFNLHQTPGGSNLEEFTDKLTEDWSNFYDRDTLEAQFACRNGDPMFEGRKGGVADCNPGDLWRPAAVISDAVTLLSNNFRPGFRTEGDYDLRNNANIANDSRLGGKGFDFDGQNGIDNANPLNEENFRLDLNGDGEYSGTVEESDITAAAAYQLKRLKNGFYENNFVTSFEWYKDDGNPDDFDNLSGTGTGGTAIDGGNFTDQSSQTIEYSSGNNPDSEFSSYFNSFITPVQRRAKFPVYLMETCMKLPVSECEVDDWFVGFDDATAPGNLITSSNVLDTGSPANYKNYAVDDRQIAGTTADPATDANIVPSWNSNEIRRYPRRVAFKRDTTYKLVDDSTPTPKPLTPGENPIPLGLNANQINEYPKGKGVPQKTSNSSLWFRTVAGDDPYANDGANNSTYNDGNILSIDDELGGGQFGAGSVDITAQPLLVPVIQFQNPRGTPAANFKVQGTASDKPNWLQKASESTFNLVVGSGDAPPRSTPPEPNGGLPNFARYIENWTGSDAKISGSFIQFKRSSYATGPFTSVVTDKGKEVSRFGYDVKNPGPYRNSNGQGKQPHYLPPKRVYGFDTGLLYQFPDLFSATFTQPATSQPIELFREVDRENLWVQNLLCATQEDAGSYNGFALPESQRPETCPVQ